MEVHTKLDFTKYLVEIAPCCDSGLEFIHGFYAHLRSAYRMQFIGRSVLPEDRWYSGQTTQPCGQHESLQNASVLLDFDLMQF